MELLDGGWHRNQVLHEAELDLEEWGSSYIDDFAFTSLEVGRDDQLKVSVFLFCSELW